MNSEYFQQLLKLVISWFTSGPAGIISGIVGGLGVLYVIRTILKKMADAKFQNTLKDVSETAGNVSKEVSGDMEANDRLINALLAIKEKSSTTAPAKPNKPVPDNVPSITTPANGYSRVPFKVVTKNVPEGTVIMAEKRWAIGKVSATGVTEVVIVSPGNRSIDVKVGEEWYSCPMIILEE